MKDKNRYHAEEPFQDSEQEGIQAEDVAVDDVNAEEEPVQEETSESEILRLNKELEESKAATEKEKREYMFLMAEFDNFRKRTLKEKSEIIKNAGEQVFKGLLPILDDFERAMKALQDSDDSMAAKEGTELIYNKLIGYLKTKGLSVIETEGKDFDTDLHEAVAQFPVNEEDKKGKIFDTVQTGYTLNGKVIRFAKVVVGI